MFISQSAKPHFFFLSSNFPGLPFFLEHDITSRHNLLFTCPYSSYCIHSVSVSLLRESIMKIWLGSLSYFFLSIFSSSFFCLKRYHNNGLRHSKSVVHRFCSRTCTVLCKSNHIL